jgi:hypothetical protein
MLALDVLDGGSFRVRHERDRPRHGVISAHRGEADSIQEWNKIAHVLVAVRVAMISVTRRLVAGGVGRGGTQATIELLWTWTADFNAGNAEKVYSLFSSELRYDFRAIRAQLQRLPSSSSFPGWAKKCRTTLQIKEPWFG